MDLPSDHFTHVVSSFALVVLPDPRAALAEIRRVLRPSGTAAFTIWKSVGWHDIACAAVESIPGAPRFPSFQEFSASFAKSGLPDHDQWIFPAFFEEQMRKAGFEDVKTVLHENQTRYKDAEECVQIFTSLMNFAVANIWSPEERQIVEPHLAHAMLEVAKGRFGDGEVVLDWEAYCVTAKVPVSKS